MLSQKAFLEKIEKLTHEYAQFNTKDLPFRSYVVDACASNQCGRYGKTWQCPPGIGNIEDLQKQCLSYAKAIVFTTVHELEDSFDIEGMGKGRELHEKITDEVIDGLDKTKIKVLSAESCSLCKTCTYPTAPCRYPDKARSSLEANGISVVELAKEQGINYKNANNTVTYFSLILFSN